MEIKQLKDIVFQALEELGKGFLACARFDNDALEAWRQQRAPTLSREEFLKSDELLTDIYNESLSLTYRLLFLFYAEGRDLLPVDEQHPFLECFKIDDQQLARAVDLLSRKVSYRDLDVRHLGTVYESLLEYHVAIVDQEYSLIYRSRESKRRSSGSYYTPDYIVQYIVEKTLGPILRGETRAGLGNGKPQSLSSAEILEVKVLDPAMGAGHFLIAATEYLARAYNTARTREGKTKEDFIHYKRIIAERCIYGVDSNVMAVELAKLSMRLITMDKERPLTFLDHHLKHGDALVGAWKKELGNEFEASFSEQVPNIMRNLLEIRDISDVRAKKVLNREVDQLQQPFRNVADSWLASHLGETARAKAENAFHWELEFPEVWFDKSGKRLQSPGFTAVLGNPPYLIEARNNAELFRTLKRIPSLSQQYEKNMDLFGFFSHRSLALTQPFGLHAFIVPNYILSRTSANKLREQISRRACIRLFVDFNGFPVFAESPGHHSCIYVVQLNPATEQTTRYLTIKTGEKQKYEQKLASVQDQLANEARYKQIHFTLSAGKLIPVSPEKSDFVSKIAGTRGQTYPKELVVRGVDTSPSNVDGKGVFVLSQNELDQIKASLTPNEHTLIQPFYQPKQIDRFKFDPKNNYWLIYADKVARQEMKSSPDLYPTLVAHLDSFSTFITSDNAPYGLHRPKARNNFTNPKKIIFVRKTSHARFAVVNQPYFVDEGCYIMLPIPDGPSEHFFTAVFNSSIASYWFKKHKTHGGQLQIDKEIVLSFPIPVPSSHHYSTLVHLSELLHQKFTQETYDYCDRVVASLYGFTDTEHQELLELLQ